MEAELRRRWPVEGLAEVRESLLEAYADGTRQYHDLVHLREVLDRIDELVTVDLVVEQVLSDGELLAVRLAAWFHDAVYDRLPAAEERSALWANAALKETTSAGLVDEIVRLVRLTEQHRPESSDLPGAVLCDADIAILGADPARYGEYTRAVRAEYAQYDDSTFARGRLAILDQFSAGEHIFTTGYGRRVWEPAARRNLAVERASLARLVDG